MWASLDEKALWLERQMHTATEDCGQPGGTCSVMGTPKRRAQRRRSRLIQVDLSGRGGERRGCGAGGQSGRGVKEWTHRRGRLFTVIGAVLPQCLKIPPRRAGT